jgi:dTDP-4-amino-4,6-dideoxygalactose transaminase
MSLPRTIEPSPPTTGSSKEGGVVGAYERAFAVRTAAAHALSFSFARNALAATFRAAGLVEGDEVLLSPLTCKVVPLAVLSAGLRPVYADIDAQTLNLDHGQLAARRNDRTRAVLFQRTYGRGEGAEAAIAFARTHALLAVEDCAQCMPAGDAWAGDAAVFSNNPGKPLPAGSGGVVVTNDAVLAGRVAAIRSSLPLARGVAATRTRADAWVRNHLLSPRRYWPAFELNRRFDPAYRSRSRAEEIAEEVDAVATRITDAQAAAGRRWLNRIDDVVRHRIACCAGYSAALRDCRGCTMPAAHTVAPLHFFPILVERKAELLSAAKRARIEVVAWPLSTPIYPVTDVNALQTYGYAPGSCPVAEAVADRIVGLPTHGLVTRADVERAVRLVREHVA